MPSVALVLRISRNGSARGLRGLALGRHFINPETHLLKCERQQGTSFAPTMTRTKVVARTIRSHRTGGRRSRKYSSLANRIQHDHRYLALGLELIVGVGRPEFERLFPKPNAFFARRRPGPRVYLRRPDLDFDVGVRKDIAIPSRVLGCAAL